MNKSAKLFCLVALQFLVSCATDQAAQLRAEKPFSAGLLGAQYRPRPDVGIGFGVDFRERLACESFLCSEDERDDGIEFDDDLHVTGKQKQTEVGVYTNYFPWETSAFFVGGGFTQRWASADIKIKETGEKVDYKSSTLYLRPALGWNWIWEPGFSLFLDFGFGIPLSHSRDISSSVSSEAKDAAKYLDDNLFNTYKNPVGGGSSMIGWSFAF